MAVRGTLIAESVRTGGSLERVPLHVHKITRLDAGDTGAGQPTTWTFIEFEIADDQADVLAEELSGALRERGGWYCDFRSAAETYVVFAGRTFRYRRGDQAGRNTAEAYARSVGVPESQLDWPEWDV